MDRRTDFATNASSDDARSDARLVESTYRSLRKGLEDNKNEPAAADFYYGEMQMRRAAAKSRSVERSVISLYWLVSGYALRAWRAVTALAAVLALSSLAFYAFGLPHPHEAVSRVDRINTAVILSLESAVSLLRGPPNTLVTTAGHYVEFALRLLGPVLFGLALLSLRGRVKR